MRKNITDLSNHYVVFGTGPSAIATIHGIIDTCNNDNKKIFVIDAGITNNMDLSFEKSKKKYTMPSPKFKIVKNRYVYDSFKSLINLTEDGFEAVGSLAKGGLSNIWGACIQPYSAKELSQFPYSYSEIKNIYSKIYKILTNTDTDWDKKGEIINKSNCFFMDTPLLAINLKNGSNESCHLKCCNDGCVNCNRNVFNSGNEFDILNKSDKVIYMNNLFISSVDYKEEHYLINCIEISSSKDKIIKANKIYSCLGAISTTKIILQMSKKTSSVPLLTTPGGAFFIYSFKEFHNLNHQILSSRSFRGDLNNNLFEGNIFPFSENLIKTYFGQKLGKLLLILFGKLIFSRVFIANIYFSSDLSASTLININDEVKISAKTSSKLKFIFKKVMKNIYKEFFKRGELFIRFSPYTRRERLNLTATFFVCNPL